MLTRIIAVVLLLASSAVRADSGNSVSIGLDYSSGEYGGDTSTDILYVPLTGRTQYDDFFLRLTVPYIRVSGVAGVVRGMGKIKTTTNNTTTTSGLGDIIASAGYTLFRRESVMLDVVGNIKFGTADADKNLGTGENDYSAQFDGYYAISATTLFATAGYKIVGEPAGIKVNDIAYVALGFSQKISDTGSVGMMLDAAQSSTKLYGGVREVSVFAAKKLNPDLKVQVNLLKGFADGSPDYGASVTLIGYN